LDQIPNKILQRIHLLEIPHILLPSYRRRYFLESRTWEPSPSRSGPLARSGNTHILPTDIINSLHEKNIYFLSQLADPITTTLWSQGWKKANELGISGAPELHYRNYIKALQLGHIRLSDREDELVWQKDPTGAYTPKLGYIALSLDLFQQQPIWWWKGLWKLKCPQKEKLFLWAALNQKIPTWEILQK
jgi:hypothetical protein